MLCCCAFWLGCLQLLDVLEFEIPSGNTGNILEFNCTCWKLLCNMSMFDDCLAAVKLLGKWLTQFINFFLMLATFDGQTFISCCLDYCNSLLHGISDSLYNVCSQSKMLQHVLSLARCGVIISPQFSVSCTGYQSRQRIHFKIAGCVFLALTRQAPATLPTTAAWYPTQNNAKSALLTELLSPPNVCAIGIQRFSTAGSQVWNGLQSVLRTWHLTVSNENFTLVWWDLSA